MADWKASVQAQFLAKPQEFVDYLLANRCLKGAVRGALSEAILAHQDRPEVAEMFWLLLVPHRLSLVSVSGRCNLSCRMCGGSRGELRYLDRAHLEQMLNHTPTVETVTFVAGDSEPLLNPDLADNLRLVQEHKANWDIVSNGHLLDDRLIDAMVSDRFASRLNISLDACRETTYRAIRHASLENVLARLRALRDARKSRQARFPTLSLLMVGMEDNIGELPEFVRLAAELGAERVHVDHMMGSYSPGDFLRNPDWRAAVREARAAGAGAGVQLDLPHDVGPLLQDPPPARLAACALKPAAAVAGRTPPPPQGIPSADRCPWLPDVHVQLDGVMNPCCLVPVPIGNIYDAPLHGNILYLQARLAHMNGQLHRECMSSRNCAYVGVLKQMKTPPPFMTDPSAPEVRVGGGGKG